MCLGRELLHSRMEQGGVPGKGALIEAFTDMLCLLRASQVRGLSMEFAVPNWRLHERFRYSKSYPSYLAMCLSDICALVYAHAFSEPRCVLADLSAGVLRIEAVQPALQRPKSALGVIARSIPYCRKAP